MVELKKVLVLEDESSIRSFVVINLRRSGYEPIEAETGEQALEQLRQNPDIKVALLDVMLPDIDGFEVCRRIRASDSKIGIIMLSATALGLLLLFGGQAASHAGNPMGSVLSSYFWVVWPIGGIACGITSLAMRAASDT